MKKEPMQNILSSLSRDQRSVTPLSRDQRSVTPLSRDQRSVTPKHKLWLIRQRVAPMWSITNDNLTNTQQDGISALFLFPHSQQDE